VSDTDSFIEEVTEEVRRDRLYGYMRRYGWIAVLAVVLIVGGAGWREYRKAQDMAQAQAFGDAIMAALEAEAPAERIAALSDVAAPGAGGQALLDLMIAAEEGSDGDGAAAAARLQAVSGNTDAPAIYRQIAQFKALSRDDTGLTAQERLAGLEALAVPGQPLNLLAQEQLALLEIKAGETDAALDRLRVVAQDSAASAGLRRRAQQLIVALGGVLDEG
jgi:hypothetical protein